jgi:paraquat-inducible protein A
MTMLTRATLERRAVWCAIHAAGDYPGPDAIGCASCDLVLPPDAGGHPCPRCAVRVDRRRAHAISQTLALLIATVALTPLAYSQPMSEMWKAGTPDPHGILNGIGLLFQSGFWYFGIIISCVSVLFPLTKIVALSWFLASIWHGSRVHFRRKTELHRFVDDVGRWSMLDPFTVMVFTPMVQIGTLAHIDIMPGSLSFMATVILSMLAARAFDPRLMWDIAREPQSQPVSFRAPQELQAEAIPR